MSETKTDALASMLAQYAKNNETRKPFEEKKIFDLKNYFSTFLKDKEQSATKKIRILPTADGSTPFVEMHGHKIQVEGEWKTFACLKHEEQTDCPFCEARELLLATGQEKEKELAKKYGAKKMYVVKVIDRDNEADGVKFWRFNHDYRKTGTFDKIFGVLQAAKKDITDVNTGHDLLITIGRDQNQKPVVSSVAAEMAPSLLSENPELVTLWTSDARTWKDVYSVRTYDYLKIIVMGGVPKYDKVQGKFVDSATLVEATDNFDANSEITMGTSNVKPNIVESTPAVNTAPVTTPTAEEESDLPF